MSDRPSDLRPGTEFAGFRILGLIGRGGMGVVYRAEQLRYGRTVALKVLAPELSSDPGFRERFEQEWQAAAGLDHPNIVPIFDAGEADGVLYTAMRYVEGTDLAALLATRGPLEPHEALRIVGQVATALDFVHSRGLVHRDVKPGNVLIASDGRRGEEHVYLADFGIAKGGRAKGLTRTGLFVGTIDYAAPEQIEGRELDGRADVYALGCVLYQCLTGARPYEKDSEVSLMYAHLNEPPPAPSVRRPELPGGLDTVIARALAKRPDDRYPTCRTLVDAARAALAGAAATPTVVGATLAPTAIDEPADDRTVVEGGVAAGVRTVADVDAPDGRAVAGSPPSPPPDRPASVAGRPWWRSRAAIVVAAAVVVAGAGAGIAIALTGGGGGSAAASSSGTSQAASDGATGGSGAGTTAGTTGSDPETTESTVTSAASTDPTLMAYESARDGDTDVYLMGADGRRARLTDAPGTDGSPSLSPDGTQLVFSSDRDGDLDLYVIGLDGGDVTQLTDLPGSEVNASWSADGTLIAFEERPPDEDSELSAIEPTGGGLGRLTDNEVADGHPSWSPDGSAIAYASDEGGDLEIWVMTDDGEARALTDNDASDAAPAWSPDGALIAFASDRDGSPGLWTMAPDGTGATRVADADIETFSAWAPDSGAILFDAESGEGFELYGVGAGGGQPVRLTNDLTFDADPDAVAAPFPEGLDEPPFLTDETAFPTAREAHLITSYPARRGSCSRTEEKDVDPLAALAVVCQDGKVTLYLELFDTAEELEQTYDDLAKQYGVSRDQGSCETDANAEGTWQQDGKTKGRLLCFTGEGPTRVAIWTFDELGVLTWAQRQGDARKGLYRYWTTAGPVP